MKFPRGSGRLVTVLLPTRGRQKEVLESMLSWIYRAENPKLVEFVLRVDSNDLGTLDFLEDIVYVVRIRGVAVSVLIGPRGRGWQDIYTWLPDMSRAGTGDWLCIWNDDARMEQTHWDRVLLDAEVPSTGEILWPERVIADTCFFRFLVSNMPHSYSYGVWRRKAFEVLGHFSEVTLADEWLYRVNTIAGCFYCSSSIKIGHGRGEMKDQTWEQGARDATHPCLAQLDITETRRGILRDVAKLVSYMESK